MPVRLIVEQETVAELAPYVEAMRLLEGTDACPRCNGKGSDPAWPGRGFRCQWCNATGRVPHVTHVTSPQQPPCGECLGSGLMVDHDGVTHRCEACRPKAEAPCGTCRGTGRIEVANGELDYCPTCDGR